MQHIQVPQNYLTELASNSLFLEDILDNYRNFLSHSNLSKEERFRMSQMCKVLKQYLDSNFTRPLSIDQIALIMPYAELLLQRSGNPAAFQRFKSIINPGNLNYEVNHPSNPDLSGDLQRFHG